MADTKRRTLFREVNEQIRRINSGFDAHASTYLVLCECENAECIERVEVPAAVYDEVRRSDERFVVLAGHERGLDERVVSSGGYCVIRVSKSELRLVEDLRPAADGAGIPSHTPLPAA